MKNKLIALTFLVFITIGIIGCSNNTPADNPTKEDTSQNKSTTSQNTKTQVTGDKATIDKVIDLALKQIDGTIIEIDHEDNTDYYDVDIVKDMSKYEFKIDASTNKIIENKLNKNDTTELGEVKFALKDAVILALKESNGGFIDSISLENSTSGNYYNFDIVNGKDEYDIDINALDGNILKSNKEIRD